MLQLQKSIFCRHQSCNRFSQGSSIYGESLESFWNTLFTMIQCPMVLFHRLHIIHKGRKGSLQWRNLVDSTLMKWPNLISPIMRRADIMCFLMCYDKNHITSNIMDVLFLPKVFESVRKKSDTSRWCGTFYKITGPGFFGFCCCCFVFYIF